MMNRFRRFYISVTLMLLPTVDQIIGAIHRLLVLLDRQLDALEKKLDAEAVELANANADRRAGLAAVERAYDRRAGAAIDRAAAVQSKVEAASAARSRVAAALEL